MTSIKLRFAGEYYKSLDLKNRVNIPAKFRKALDPVNDKTFVITRGFDRCLVLYPIYEWNIVEQQLSSLSSIRNKHRSFVRSVVRHASYIQYDAQGRVIIPEELKKFCSIEKDIVIIGMINKIELWAPQALEEHDKSNNQTEEFDDLADDISF